MKPQPVLIDGNSLVKRCIMATALDDLKAGGTFTGGVYGTLTSLRAFLNMPENRTLGPVIAFFDGGIPPKRLKLLPGYKKKREEQKHLLTDEEKEKAFAQMALAREMLRYLGVFCLSYKDREADDCVAAAVSCYAGDETEPVVVTGDKDLWQTVELGARVWDLNKKRWVTDENFVEAADVAPRTYVVFKALVGDPSDSIAGCPGCGKKRARALIVEATEKHPLFEDGTPARQLKLLRLMLMERTKPKKFERALCDNAEYLHRVINATRLWGSFGKQTGLEKRLLDFVPKVQVRPFLRFCAKLKFKSVMGDPDRFLTPFKRAAERGGK